MTGDQLFVIMALFRRGTAYYKGFIVMLEQIKTAVSNVNGSISYYIPDLEKGVPYTTVTVLTSGDYYLTVYGSLCFSQPSHEKILKFCKPIGRDITAEKYFSEKKRK